MEQNQPSPTPPPADTAAAGAEGAATASAAGGDGGGAAQQAAPERPSDAMILEQENAIRQEEAAKIPFVGDLEPLSALKAEYQAGSEVFRTKIEGLEQHYAHVRRTRGDGNCFFRSFIFRYLEDLLSRRDYEERNRVLARLRDADKQMQDAGFQPMVYEDMQSVLTIQLDAVNGSEDSLTPDILITNMRDDMVSNMIVSFLRLAVSAEIAGRCEFFAPFIMGMSDEGLSVEAFRRKCVEPMGEESDHVHIVALTDLLQVPVRVLYLDRSMDGASADPASVNHHDFVPEALSVTAGSSSTAVKPRVHLLYRPGHYDILYSKPDNRGGVAGPGQQQTAAGQQFDQGAVSAALAAAMSNVGAGQQL